MVLCLVAGVAEHHTLVTGALFADVLGALAIHAACDVGTLFVEGCEDTAALCLELVGRLGVTYFGNGFADGVLDVHIFLAGDFTGDDDLSCGDHGLACHV